MRPYRKPGGAVRWTVMLAVPAVLMLAVPSASQCPWDGSPDCSPALAPYASCYRSVDLTAAQGCLTPTNNGMGTVCSPGGPVMGATLLFVSQTAMALRPSAFCQWNCGGEVCLIRLSDGLPVELMDFSVTEAPADSGDDRPDEADDGGSPRRGTDASPRP